MNILENSEDHINSAKDDSIVDNGHIAIQRNEKD